MWPRSHQNVAPAAPNGRIVAPESGCIPVCMSRSALCVAVLRLAYGGADFLNIGRIAQSPRRKLGSDQIVFANEEYGQAAFLIDHVADPSLPRLIEIYAVDAGGEDRPQLEVPQSG